MAYPTAKKRDIKMNDIVRSQSETTKSNRANDKFDWITCSNATATRKLKTFTTR